MHIATSPLTGRIFMGRVNKAGNAFLTGKTDVTSDVLKAIVEKAEYHGGAFVIEGGDKTYKLAVAEVTPDEPEKFDHLAGRGMHELRFDELTDYVMGIDGDATAQRQAVAWIVSELQRKTNEEAAASAK